jgi:hypothetical protein
LQAEEDDNGAEGEEAVNMSLTRTGHTSSAAVQSTGRNAGVGVTNLPNLTTGRASIMNLDAAIQIRCMSKMESLKISNPMWLTGLGLCESRIILNDQVC